jgi:AcrR family transcriptional regulator
VLYQQFGDVAGIFVALIDREGSRAAAQFAEAVESPAAIEGDGPLLRTFEGILRAIDANPASWRLFLIPPQGAPPELHQRLADSTDRVRRFIQDRLLGTFPDLADPEYAARVVHAVGRELLLLRLTEPEKATTERLAALLREIIGRAPRVS